VVVANPGRKQNLRRSRANPANRKTGMSQSKSQSKEVAADQQKRFQEMRARLLLTQDPQNRLNSSSQQVARDRL